MNVLSGRTTVGLLLASVAFGGTPALAQDYPTRPIRVIVPFSAGGATTATMRLVEPGMSQVLGQSVVIDNRPGGSATIGTSVVARAAPDGYTVGVANTSFATNPLLFAKLPYDTDKDFQPVSLIGITPFVMSVHPSVPARSVKELIALARAKPDAIAFSSSGVGSSSRLATEYFMHLTKTRMLHVPFQGGGPALTAVLSGECALFFTSIPPALGYFKSGRVRPLGITSAKRDPSLPEVPTIAETVPGFEHAEWTGLVVPAGTPPAIIAKLQQAVARTVSDPALKQRFAALGAWPSGSTTAEFAAFIQAERKKWAPVIKAANIRLN